MEYTKYLKLYIPNHNDEVIAFRENYAQDIKKIDKEIAELNLMLKTIGDTLGVVVTLMNMQKE